MIEHTNMQFKRLMSSKNPISAYAISTYSKANDAWTFRKLAYTLDDATETGQGWVNLKLCDDFLVEPR